MKMSSSVSPKAIQKIAEDNFRGGYFCCEALMSAMKTGFELDVPDEVIAMSSGMAVGAGKSGCMCGALNGGILAWACSLAVPSRKVRKTRR